MFLIGLKENTWNGTTERQVQKFFHQMYKNNIVQVSGATKHKMIKQCDVFGLGLHLNPYLCMQARL